MSFNVNAVKFAVRRGAKYVVKHSPTILTILGVGMMGGATVNAIIEAPKAHDELAALDEENDISPKTYLKRKIQIIVYHYWSTLFLGLGGAGLIFWGHHVTIGQTAAAVAAYNLKSDELAKLEQKIVDQDGNKRIEEMRDEILKEKVCTDNISEKDILDTGKGKMLCYEVISGRYFYSDIEKIRKACNDMNDWINESRQYGEDIEVSLNEWYDYLGLERTKIGNKLGWSNKVVNLKFTSLLTPDNVPCLCVGYREAPVWEFDTTLSERNICSDDWCDRAPSIL